MMKVLIISDSLGLPRPVPEIVEEEDTWAYLLSKEYFVKQISFGGATVKDLFSQVVYAKMFKPDIVIIQAGIVDCAPRAFTKFENEFINKFKFTKYIFKKFINNERIIWIRKVRKVTYTSNPEFKSFVKIFKKSFDNLFWIEIVNANDKYELKVPGIKKKIKEFNEILSNELKNNLISTSDLNETDIMSDNIHLNKEGNFKIFCKIKNVLEKNS